MVMNRLPPLELLRLLTTGFVHDFSRFFFRWSQLHLSSASNGTGCG
jgi:hypothetical protein